jgi:hypothetical protein
MHSEIMKELHAEKADMNDGDTLYIISYKWWQLWCEAVNYDCDDDGNEQVDVDGSNVRAIGPIDNGHLLVNRGKGSNNDLRANLIKDTDYTLVSEQYVHDRAIALAIGLLIVCR